MNLYSCPDCLDNTCEKCFRYISSHNTLIRNEDNIPINKQGVQLFTLGNIVYYHYDHFIETKKNTTFSLFNFPSAKQWEKWKLNNKEVKIVSRDYETNEELVYFSQLKIYNNILTILPQDSNAIFKSIINNTIFWNVNKKLHFIYISCEEWCFTTQKIMHDPSLFVDVERNKLGVKYPIPQPPLDKQTTFILKLEEGQIKWVPEVKLI